MFQALLISAGGKHKAVAMKSLRSCSEKSKASFFSEAEILRSIDHPNIVKLIGVCSKTEPFFIVYELEENVSLLNFLRSPDGLKLNAMERTNICHKVRGHLKKNCSRVYWCSRKYWCFYSFSKLLTMTNIIIIVNEKLCLINLKHFQNLVLCKKAKTWTNFKILLIHYLILWI